MKRRLITLLVALLLGSAGFMLKAQPGGSEDPDINCGSTCKNIEGLNVCKSGADPTEACSQLVGVNGCVSSPGSPSCQ